MLEVAEITGASGVPYYSQWESPGLVGHFLDGSLSPEDDPRWADSGARVPAEYGFWSTRACGLACLKMILAARGRQVPPMMRLVDRALAWGAYLPDGLRVIGMIYQPFSDWVRHDYGIAAEVAPDLTLDRLIQAATPRTPVIASVHHSIRWPPAIPPERGGHLVLVTGATADRIRLHNPSGLPGTSQADALMATSDFARFFAGRGLVVGSS
jgi:hypothetical protein